MSRIYQAPNKTTTSAAAAATTTASPPIVNNKPIAPSNVKLYVNNLNKNGSVSPSTLTSTNSSSNSSLASSDKQSHDDFNPSSSSCSNTTQITLNSIAPSEVDSMSQEQINYLINRLETVTARLETVAQKSAAIHTNGVGSRHTNGSSSAAESETIPVSVTAYDDLISNSLLTFIQMSAKIGNDVKTIADLVEKLFKYERSFLLEASKCVQPSQDVLTKFYQLFSKNIEEIANFREKNRKSEFFNHLSAISESIGALGWIAVQPAPCPYVKEMSDAAQFYTNRVLKDYKEKDANHASWVKLWLQLLNELQAYVKQYHTTGVVWNSQKKSLNFEPSHVGTSTSNGTATAATSGGAKPPPPPPMPNFTELFADDKKSSSGPSAVSTQALFSEINKGGAITSGLRKVTADQQTHKNPELRGSSVVPAVAAPITKVTSKQQEQQQQQKPPVFELDDKKWKIEYQNKQNNLVVDNTDLKHTVYIYKCKESTITVKGKVNSILIDSCSRVGLLFDDVLSTVEFINSQNVQMQVIGRVPTVAIEKTDGCQVYLSRKSMDTQIVSSKSSAMNVLVPNEHDDDFTEHPVPEQFRTSIDLKSRKLATTATESC